MFSRVSISFQSIQSKWLVFRANSFDCIDYLQIKDGNLKAMILRWLEQISHSLPFEEVQHKTFQISKNTPGAGQWLLNSRRFTDWRDDWRDGNTRKLWCHGIRKKILSKFRFTMQRLMGSASTGKTVLAYERNNSISSPVIFQVLICRVIGRLSSTTSRRFTRTIEM